MKRPLFSAGVLVFAALLLCACLTYKIVFWLSVATLVSALLILILARGKSWSFSAFICLAVCCIAISGFYIFTVKGPENSKKLIGKSVNLTATVTQTPEYKSGYYIYKIKTESIDFPNVNQRINLEICLNKRLFEINDTVKAKMSFYELDEQYKTTNYADGVYVRCYPIKISGTGSKPQNFNSFASGIRVKTINCIIRNLPKEVSGILIGLITNGSKYLDDETYSAFRTCGLSHVISVSGMHMALLSNAIMLFLMQFGLAKRLRFIFCLPVLLLYTAISGFSPAAIRSVIMISTVFLGDMFFRRSDSLTNLGITGFLMLLISPNLIYSLSFLLSFTSMTGILIATPFCIKISNKIHIKGLLGDFLRYITSISFTTISANLATLPMVLLVWSGVSTVSVIANLFISFAVSICLIFGIVLVTLILIFGENDIFVFMFKPIEYILWYIRNTAISISDIPFSYVRMSVSTLLFICCVGCLIAAAVCFVKKLPKQRVWSAVNYATVFMIASIIIYKII